MPHWDERETYLATHRRVLALIGLVTVAWGIVLGWLFFGPSIPKTPVRPLDIGVNLTLVLAPVLAASAAVERLLETVFNIIETNWLTLVAYLGRGLRWLKSAETELQQARQWVADVSNQYNQEMNGLQLDLTQQVGLLANGIVSEMDDVKALMAMAEKRLAEAEKSLASVTSSARYKSAKSTASVILGLMLGVILADVTALQMFALLGVATVPVKFDVLITGLVIGSGSYPVHSLVGFLQQIRDVLYSTKTALAKADQPASS